jgi:hypothetical protein
MSVSTIDGQQIALGFHHFGGTLEKVAGCADCSPYPQASLSVLGGVRVFQALLDVLYGDQAFELKMLVHHQQLFHAMLMEDGFGLVQRGADWHSDEVFLRHYLADRNVGARLKA